MQFGLKSPHSGTYEIYQQDCPQDNPQDCGKSSKGLRYKIMFDGSGPHTHRFLNLFLKYF